MKEAALAMCSHLADTFAEWIGRSAHFKALPLLLEEGCHCVTAAQERCRQWIGPRNNPACPFMWAGSASSGSSQQLVGRVPTIPEGQDGAAEQEMLGLVQVGCTDAQQRWYQLQEVEGTHHLPHQKPWWSRFRWLFNCQWVRWRPQASKMPVSWEKTGTSKIEPTHIPLHECQCGYDLWDLALWCTGMAGSVWWSEHASTHFGSLQGYPGKWAHSLPGAWTYRWMNCWGAWTVLSETCTTTTVDPFIVQNPSEGTRDHGGIHAESPWSSSSGEMRIPRPSAKWREGLRWDCFYYGLIPSLRDVLSFTMADLPEREQADTSFDTLYHLAKKLEAHHQPRNMTKEELWPWPPQGLQEVFHPQGCASYCGSRFVPTRSWTSGECTTQTRPHRGIITEDDTSHESLPEAGMLLFDVQGHRTLCEGLSTLRSLLHMAQGTFKLLGVGRRTGCLPQRTTPWISDQGHFLPRGGPSPENRA